jgi:hypothetical protein
MNRLHLKIIAAITMVIDHIGVIFLYPGTNIYDIFRSIGRISFVLFAYLLAEGFHKTKDVNKYLLRIAVFAAGIEVFLIAYYFISKENMILTFNIFWTLLAGLVSLYLFYQKNHWYKLLIIPLVFISEFIHLSYGAYGVLMILLFGVYQNKITNVLHLIFLNLLFVQSPFSSNLDFNAKYPEMQWFSLIALVFILLYNQKMGKYKMKWFFYLFYPGHLLVLYLINMII